MNAYLYNSYICIFFLLLFILTIYKFIVQIIMFRSDFSYFRLFIMFSDLSKIGSQKSEHELFQKLLAPALLKNL